MSQSRFILEMFSPADLAPVMERAAGSMYALPYLMEFQRVGEAVKRAIDPTSGTFLMRCPGLIRRMDLTRQFLLHFHGQFFVFSIHRSRDNVEFEGEVPSPELKDELQKAIVDAFGAYGRWGCGVTNPGEAVHPKFT